MTSAAPSEAEPASPAAGADGENGTSAEQSAVSRQVGIIVGAGVLLVVVLFLITAVSKDGGTSSPAPSATATEQATPATPEAPPAVNEEPLPPQVADRAEALRTQVDAATGEEREQRLTELVQLLAGAGRLDLAAVEQKRLAELQNTAAAWRHAGNLYYDWMVTVNDDQQQRARIAQESIAAYEEVLEREPGNLDARTDMAVAYLNTSTPMQGVEEIAAVLEADSTHVPARFNYGVMLTMIGRTEQARAQFERVKQIVDDPQSPYYQRADEALQTMAQTPTGPS